MTGEEIMKLLEIHSDGESYTSELISLYKEAFPPEEKKPWELMEQLYEEKKMEILAIVEDDIFLGLAVNMLHGEYALLDYFAIAKEKRESGYGSRAIRKLQERFAGKKYILEIELPLPDADNLPERIRRKSFYLRNGLKETHVYANVYQTDFELLTPDGVLSYVEYISFLQGILGKKWLEFLNPSELYDVKPV